MGVLSRFKPSQKTRGQSSTSGRSSTTAINAADVEKDGKNVAASGNYPPIKIFRFRIFAMAMIVSLGGLIFGYDTGQISGFLEMPDFLDRFADIRTTNPPSFSNVREGLIVGLLSIGTLVGAILAGPIADKLGRKKCIIFWDVIFIVGVVVQITTSRSWLQLTLGRLVAGLGVGGLSVLTPMYQSETAPRQIRGALVSCYQLFITLGILIAYCINFGTEKMPNPSSWRITIGVGFIFPTAMAAGILCLKESPRWEYRHGKIDSARATIAASYGVSEDHPEVKREMREIKEKFDAESAGGAKHHWYEVFTGPRMAYRLLLGISLQALQQLTGANFFFYYGTSTFKQVGLANPYVTSMILGGVNFGSTFLGLYVVENFGRRKSLIFGALWMFMCFLIFASMGHFLLFMGKDAKTAGYVMIVFTCLFILVYAMTWAPIVWALISEIYPSRYRARAMGYATASNWTWNFLLAFFTSYITDAIDYRYGYVFAACNFLGALVVYFFVCESQGRSLEEIDTMYVSCVPPWKSSGWVAPEGVDLAQTDKALATPESHDIRKGMYRSEGPGEERRETVNSQDL